jgi:hypothetical protein
MLDRICAVSFARRAREWMAIVAAHQVLAGLVRLGHHVHAAGLGAEAAIVADGGLTARLRPPALRSADRLTLISAPAECASLSASLRSGERV